MKILLVAGHGAGDPGAYGCGYKEAELTRELVKMISDEAPGLFEVYDTTKNLYEENKKTVFPYKNYDYTLEIHFNAFKADNLGDGKPMGTEIYVHPSMGQGFEAYLLRSIANLGFMNRGVKSSVLYSGNVNKAAKQGAAASLLEICFIDDRDDMNVYLDKKKEVAETIKNCFITFFKLKEEKLPVEELKELKSRISALEDEIEKLKKEKERVYHYFSELPGYARTIIEELYNRNLYYGNGAADLNLPETLMRALVINYRAGIYKEG